MDKYRIEYECSDGYVDEVIVYAANRIMALEVFADFGFEDVVAADCFRVLEDEEEWEEDYE